MVWMSAILAHVFCGGPDEDKGEIPAQPARAQAEAEYRIMRSELALAETDSLYLVLDFRRNQAVLRLRGVPAWSYRMRFSDGDSARIEKFADRFMGEEGRLVRVLQGKHLYGGKERIPPQTLEVVSKAINVSPAAIQRLLPERFLVSLGDGLFIDVHTDVEGKPRSRLQNAKRTVGKAWAVCFGGVSLDLTMEGGEGLSLHEALYPGMPVLLIPPTTAGE